MKTRYLLSFALLPMLGAAIPALAEEPVSAPTQVTPATPAQAPIQTSWLPVGMARANQAKEVAALYSQEHEARALAIRSAPERALSPQEEYTLKLIAYRTQLVEEQRQRKIMEMELELERQARIRAEERAAEAERQRRRDSIYAQHHTVHAYQRNLNDAYVQEQRLRKIIAQECHKPKPCPATSPSPTPCHNPAPSPAPAANSSSGDSLP